MSQLEDSSLARLIGVVQNYEWGVKGAASLVAASHAANCKHLPASSPSVPFEIEEDKPYSELWFGTHPNGCSQVVAIAPEGVDSLPASSPRNETHLESLYDWLKRGETSNEGSCPYLFKVLSIAKPLSLQLHPDEESAKALHEAHPEVYRDPYDKPEMAMAISNPFEAFCGFRKLKEIIALAGVVPAFGELLQNPLGKIEDPEDEEKCLKTLLSNLYSMSEEKVVERMDAIINSSIYTSLTDEVENEGYWDAAVKTVLSWFGQDQATTNMTVKAHHLFKRLHEAFPYDRGCFAPFFLNYVKLKPGECIFLAPNTIHAYIQGNCLECMRCSDNVVRAGLTPKFQDIETLKRLVDYRSLSVSHSIVKSYEVTCKIVTSGMAAMVTNKSFLRAYIPPITDSFRYYLLRLTTASKVPDLPLPQWYPLMVFVIHGRVKINQMSSVNPGASSCATLGAGSTLVIKEWDVIGVDNPSKSWRDNERMHYADMMTIDASALQEGTNTEGDALILFVLPNIEPSKLKRSKESRIPSKKGSVESKEVSSGLKANGSPQAAPESTALNAGERGSGSLGEGGLSSGGPAESGAATSDDATHLHTAASLAGPTITASSFQASSQTNTVAVVSTLERSPNSRASSDASPAVNEEQVFKSPESLEKEAQKLPHSTTKSDEDAISTKSDVAREVTTIAAAGVASRPHDLAKKGSNSTQCQSESAPKEILAEGGAASARSGTSEGATKGTIGSVRLSDISDGATAKADSIGKLASSKNKVSSDHISPQPTQPTSGSQPTSSASGFHSSRSLDRDVSETSAAIPSLEAGNVKSVDQSPARLVTEVKPAVGAEQGTISMSRDVSSKKSSAQVGKEGLVNESGGVAVVVKSLEDTARSSKERTVSQGSPRSRQTSQRGEAVVFESRPSEGVQDAAPSKIQAVTEGSSVRRSPRVIAPAVTPSVMKSATDIKDDIPLAVQEPAEQEKSKPPSKSSGLSSKDLDVAVAAKASQSPLASPTSSDN